jgi:hypothetical protein
MDDHTFLQCGLAETPGAQAATQFRDGFGVAATPFNKESR